MFDAATIWRLHPRYRVGVLGSDAVVFAEDDGHVVLEGEFLARLVPILNKGSTPQQVVAALEDEAPAEVLLYALGRLKDEGFIQATPACQSVAPDSEPGIPTPGVVVLGDLDTQSIHAEFGTPAARTAPCLQVVFTDSYHRNELARINREAVAVGRPWLLVRPGHRAVWVGPLFVPGRTGCWACLAHRLRLHHPLRAPLSAAFPISRVALNAPPTLAVTIAWAKLAGSAWAAHQRFHLLEGRLFAYTPATAQGRTHVLTRRPQCAACGDPALSEPRPLELKPAPKQFTLDGGHRTVTPGVTFERYKHHISPITGIVRALDSIDVPGAAEGVYVYGARHPFGTHPASSGELRLWDSYRSAGKGITRSQARTSGLCEALERYSGVLQGGEPRLRSKGADLGTAAVLPQQLLLFSKEQYACRDAWNASAFGRYEQVPQPYDPETEMDWTPLRSLITGHTVYLPTSYCYYEGPPTGRAFCEADSNGCAAGATHEEAILQGLLELVERDAVAVWWYNRLLRPALDLASFNEPYVERLCDHYAAHGRLVEVLDLTHDVGLPVFAAVSMPRAGRADGRLLLGFGCHLDARIALLRALTELNQMWAILAHESAADATRYTAFNSTWEEGFIAADHPQLSPDVAATRVPVEDFEPTEHDDLLADIEALVSRLAGLGLDVLALNQTRADIDLPVVRVVVPGLRHCWRRLAPGRLYEVPVRMQWLPQAYEETATNPLPLYV